MPPTTAGLPVEWVDRMDAPVPNAGAVRLDGQAQFDPMDVLEALAEDAQRHGVRIHEHTRVTSVRGTSPTNPLSGTQVVRTDNGSVRARDGCSGDRDSDPRPGRLLRPTGATALLRARISRAGLGSAWHVPVGRRADTVAAIRAHP